MFLINSLSQIEQDELKVFLLESNAKAANAGIHDKYKDWAVRI